MFTAAVAIALLAAAAVPRGDDTPSVKDVMRRVSHYVDGYGERASMVVATEQYVQTVSRDGQVGFDERHITAEFAIVRAEARGVWLGLRDVYEVDGQRIADHADRLIDVLSESEGRDDEVRRINAESARYNIGRVERDFNVPTAALFFFTPDNLDRFRFSRRDRTAAGWEIAFRETYKPTLIRTPEGTSIPSTGSVWIDASRGTILRTRLRVADFASTRSAAQATADVDVTYQHVTPLDMWLPARMTESYLVKEGRGWMRVTGRAEYSNYRRFQTSARVK